MEVEPIEAEAHEVEVKPSEPVILKKRGRPKGSLNKKTIAKMREDVVPAHGESGLHTADTADTERDIPEIETHPDSMVLDIDFTSDEFLGEKPAIVKRKPKARIPVDPLPPPETEPQSESGEDDSPPPPPAPLARQRSSLRVKTTPYLGWGESDNPQPRERETREPEPAYPASYLEVLTRGLKEARAKQYAEKVAQYDRFFQW